MILGLAGEIASGKGTAAGYLVKKYGGSSHRFSTMLRDILDRLYLGQNRENMQQLSTIVRRAFGEDTLARVVFEDIKRDGNEIIVVDGVRRLADIKYLRGLPEFKMVYLEADMEKRYARIVKRGENVDDKSKTFEKFKKDHEGEPEAQIRNLKSHSDFTVDNNGTFEDLYRQIDQIIK